MPLMWLLACTPSPGTSPTTPSTAVLASPIQLAERAVGADVTRRGDGAVISWVRYDDESRTAHVAALDPTTGLGPTHLLPADDPVAGLARGPRVVADPERILAVWSTGDPRSSTVQLAEATDPAGPWTTRRIAVGADGAPVTLVDQPGVHLDPSGEAWVVYKAEVDHPEVAYTFAREASDWAPTTVQAAPGVPCECCPHALQFTDAGDPWLVLRGNQRNLREIHGAHFRTAQPPAPGADLEPDRTVQISHTGWVLPGCPFDGPDALHVTDDDRLVAWVDPTSGASRAWLAATRDAGLTWTDARPLTGDDERLEQQPFLVQTDAGAIVAAVDDYWTGTLLLAAPPQAFLEGDEPVLAHPDATTLPLSRPLWDVVIAPYAGGLVAVGLDEDDALWAEVFSADDVSGR